MRLGRKVAKKSNPMGPVADAIASRFTVGESVDWYTVRDAADLHSGGGMHPVRLDILTDMVMKRIKGASK